MSTNVVRISDFMTGASRANYDVKPEVRESEETASNAQADFNDIYPDTDSDRASFISLVRRNLLESDQRLNAARGGDAIDRDDAANLLCADLLELFVQDKWPDGGLAVIVALHHSLRNRRGVPLKFKQYIAVSAAVSRLANAPFMAFDQALDIVESLQEADLNTEPEEGAIVQEMLHE